jgi:hypothetical protein
MMCAGSKNLSLAVLIGETRARREGPGRELPSKSAGFASCRNSKILDAAHPVNIWAVVYQIAIKY